MSLQEKKEMCNLRQAFLLSLLFSLVLLLHLSDADVGTGTSYRPPYLPTACYRNDPNQFPAGNKFAAAGEGIWDNGAACGRQYLVRCVSADTPKACTSNQTIQVRIVDRASTLVSPPAKSRTTMTLSSAAFGLIANPSVAEINIEFRQV